MTRPAFLLLLAAIGCALGVVTLQHQSRKLFIALEAGQAETKRLEEEFTQLQLEQGTWATHKRVESIASRSLDMRLPAPGATRVIDMGAAKP